MDNDLFFIIINIIIVFVIIIIIIIIIIIYLFIYFIYLFHVIFFQDQLDELVNKVEDKLKNLEPWSQGQVLSSVVEEGIG